MNMALMRDLMVQPHSACVWPGKRNRITNAAVRTGTMAAATIRVGSRTQSSRGAAPAVGEVLTPRSPPPGVTRYKGLLRGPATGGRGRRGRPGRAGRGRPARSEEHTSELQ